MNQQPLVSVLMTAYNRKKYIAEAIESVLASTYTNFELIIVDDCSKDDTVNIAKEFESKDNRITVYVNEKNLGDYPNRNRAASYANGKYIKYLDSDDIMYPHCLQVMIKAMEQFPKAGYGLSSHSQVDMPYPTSVSPHDAYLEHFNGYSHFDRAPGSAIINREVFNKIGGFRSKRFVGDTELWFLISQKFYLVKFQRDLIWDRSHLESEKIYEQSVKELKDKRKNMIASFLNSVDCPLSNKEVNTIFIRLKNNPIKQMIKKWL